MNYCDKNQGQRTSSHFVAIIISCLASFRQLFTKKDKPRDVTHTPEHYQDRRRLLSGIRSKFSLPSIVPSTLKVSLAQQSQLGTTLSTVSKEHIMPLEKIYVSHGIGVSSEAMNTIDSPANKLSYGSTFQIYGPPNTEPRSDSVGEPSHNAAFRSCAIWNNRN